MSKFADTLARGNKDIKAQRAQSTASLVEIEQQTLVNNLYRDLATKRNQLEDLYDLGADSTHSLRAVGKDFDGAAWVAKVQNFKVEILDLEVRYDIAKKTFEEWFAVEQVSTERRLSETVTIDKAGNTHVEA